MVEFFEKVIRILTMPLEVMSDGADALNAYQFDESLLYDYLGYMHYAMGPALYGTFSAVALIFIAASLWSFIVKAVNWILEMVPGL